MTFAVRNHNTFTVLFGLAGLSIREAADFLKVSEDSAKSWSSGRRQFPEGVVAELRALVASQEAEAARHLSTIRRARGAKSYRMASPVADDDAREMGFPCIGAWRAMAGRVVAGTTVGVDFEAG